MHNIFSRFNDRRSGKFQMFQEMRDMREMRHAMRHERDCDRGHARFGDGMFEGRGGFGPFGGMRGGRGGGRRGDDGSGEGGGRQRVFGRGDLPMIVLALVETTPRHGYEIIKAIEERCGGMYSPSAGAIYPTLAMLEDKGLIAIDTGEGDSSKRYAITEAGRKHLNENRVQVDGVLARLDLFARMQQNREAPALVAQAMMTLKHALQLKRESWTDSDSERIAAILKRAAFEIIDGSESASKTSK